MPMIQSGQIIRKCAEVSLETIISETLWDELIRASKTKGRRYAAVAYVTSEERIAFRSGDMLVVGASDRAIKSRQTSRALLRDLVSRGVIISSLPGLHAKAIAFPKEAFNCGSGDDAAGDARPKSMLFFGRTHGHYCGQTKGCDRRNNHRYFFLPQKMIYSASYGPSFKGVYDLARWPLTVAMMI